MLRGLSCLPDPCGPDGQEILPGRSCPLYWRCSEPAPLRSPTFIN